MHKKMIAKNAVIIFIILIIQKNNRFTIKNKIRLNQINHDPKRHRKLLASRREINRLQGAINREGMTLIALKLYFNHKGFAKITLGICKGKQVHDKRETEKTRDWNRQKERLLRG
jgi:SsrA-binding protein